MNNAWAERLLLTSRRAVAAPTRHPCRSAALSTANRNLSAREAKAGTIDTSAFAPVLGL